MDRTIVISSYEGILTRGAVVDGKELAAFECEIPDAPVRAPGAIHLGRVIGEAKGLGGVYVELGGGERGFLNLRETLKFCLESDPLLPYAPRRDLCAPSPEPPRAGASIFVQVRRIGFGRKDPLLATDLALAGPRLVFRPYRPVRRISRELEDTERRNELHALLRTLRLPHRAGVILRTAGLSASREELARELEKLVAEWEDLVARARASGSPALLRPPAPLALRLARDAVGEGKAEIAVDDPDIASSLKEEVERSWEPGRVKVTLYTGERPIFSFFNLEKEIGKLYNRELSLPGGGTLVIDYAEALTAVDVNAGRGWENPEETALRTNLEAVEELFRQVRLRGIGGLVVCDFISMSSGRNRRRLEARLRALAKSDRGRVWGGTLNRLGFAAFTRRSEVPVQVRLALERCPGCGGGSWTAGARVAAARFLDELRLRGPRKETTAQVSPRVLAILSKSRAFEKVKKDFGKKLVVEEISSDAGAPFEIR